MDRLRRILVGVDFDVESAALTAGSSVAARQALWLAQRTGARVEFLHATFDDPEHGPRLAPEAHGRAAAAVEALWSEHGGDVAASPLAFSEERPWIAMTRRVLQAEGDLVVVAKRNHTRRDDRKLGSVSKRLLHNCPCPVWVVKPEHELHHRCVLAATDLSPVGDLAVEYGAFVAQADECALCVVHAWQMPMDLQLSAARVGHEETERRKEAIAARAREHIRGLDALRELGDRVEILVGCDSPSRAILRVSERKDPDLVVMGTLSRGGVAGLLVGNTAEKLLHKLDCSVLAVKPDDFVCPLA